MVEQRIASRRLASDSTAPEHEAVAAHMHGGVRTVRRNEFVGEHVLDRLAAPDTRRPARRRVPEPHRRKAKHALRRARRECAEAIERFDEFEAAMDTLRGALECVDIKTGELCRRLCESAVIRRTALVNRICGIGAELL